MQIDVYTIAIVLSAANLAHVLALYIQYSVDRTFSGPGWWTLGSAFFGIAFALNYLRNAATIGPIAIVASNVLLCCGFALLYVGVLRFLGQVEWRGALIVLVVAVTLAEIHFTYVTDSLPARRAIASVPMAVISVLIARTLVIDKMRSVTASRCLLIVVFLAEACLLTVTAAQLIFPRDAQVSVLEPSFSHSVVYLGSLVTSTLWTFGFILLVNQRLIADRQRIIQELNVAVEQIKTLSGILPICTNCKKIRGDEGYWEQVDAYVSKHTLAEFSHGICPECAKTLYDKFSN